MKIFTSALVLVTVLSVSTLAQTSSTPETVLQINRFRWFENASYLPCDDCYQFPPVALDYRVRHRAGRGDFAALVVLKNLSSKTVKSINIDFVFRDSATESEFLTYSFRFEKEIGRRTTKEIQHKIAMGNGRTTSDLGHRVTNSSTARASAAMGHWLSTERRGN